MSLALARKYRPSTFSDLIGQESVSKTLSLALKGQKLSHAYLFSGIRGSGKTSTARIFAKALLCKEGPTDNPCGVCEHCVMANEGRHMDIIEMDAASNRGIEDIKELIEHTKYKPSMGRFKIFIIDEVHMLTVQAFNALLKTLEEPPDFVKFILATTDPLKLPATILSRMQHFRFKKLPEKSISEHLGFILNEEGVEFEPQALHIIARSSQGSLRDAITLLDQAIVFSDGRVDTASVTDMLGVVDPKILDALIDAIIKKEKEKVLDFAKQYATLEAEMILDELTLFLRDKLLNADPKLTTLTIERFFRILAEGKRLLLIGGSGDFVLLLTLFKMVEAMNVHTIDSMIHKLQNELSITQTAPQNQTGITDAANSTHSSEVIKPPTPNPQPSIQQPKPKESAQEKAEPLSIPYEIKFKQLLEKIYDRNYELGEIFENNIIFVSYKNSTLTWESSVEGGDKKTLIQNWPLIKLFVEEIFGLDTKIENITKKKPIAEAREPQKENPPKQSRPEIATQTNSCIMPEGKTEAAKDKNPNELLEEPMIQEFIKHFEPKRVVVKQKS